MPNRDELTSLRDYWGAYHHHKEQMAFAAAVLYLGATTAIVLKAKDFWPDKIPHFIMIKLLISTVVLAFVFVGWQLRNREVAAGIVHACNDLLSAATLVENRKEAGIWRGVPLPGLLVERMKELSDTGEFLAGPRTAALITYAAMVIWTLGAIVALKHAA